ncbi:MAG: glycosyl transferase [Variovorax sp.]|nr:glycosyl transferase [Variovorax sp.]
MQRCRVWLHRPPRARDAPWVAVALALWAAVWLLMLASTSLSPPVDNVEQLTWVRTLAWGYYKHPPLPTFLLWPLVQVFGLHEWVASLAGALTIVTALFVCWRLTSELRGAKMAGLATLGTLCITYYSGRTYYYNHNMVLLPLVAGAAWCCWRAFRDRSLPAWLGVGTMLGLGALAKYQVGLAVASLLFFWWSQRGWRDPLHRRGLAGAALVAGLIFVPHGLWLVTHDFAPLHYAMRTSLGTALSAGHRLLHSLNWLGDQIGRMAPALLLGTGLLAWTRWRPNPAPPPAPPAPSPDVVSVFLFSWGLLPLVLIALLGVLIGAELQLQWGTAFVPLTCAWLMEQAPRGRWRQLRWRDALLGFAAVQIMLATFSWATSPMGPQALVIHHNRNFPSQALADQLGPAARAALGGPIEVIAGPAQLAEALALRLPERPLVLIDGRIDFSPWIAPDRLARQRVLWVGGPGELPPAGAVPHMLPGALWWAARKSAD